MKQDDIKYNASKQSAKHDNLHFLLVSLRESGSGWRSETNNLIKLTRLKERDLPSCTFERSQFTYMQFMNFFFSDCKLSRINFEVLRYLGRKTFLFCQRCLRTAKNISNSCFKTSERLSSSKYMPKILWH